MAQLAINCHPWELICGQFSYLNELMRDGDAQVGPQTQRCPASELPENISIMISAAPEPVESDWVVARVSAFHTSSQKTQVHPVPNEYTLCNAD